jgi:probable rRNA maturation factor
MRRAAKNACKIDVLIESGLWKEPRTVKSLIRRAIKESAAAVSTSGAELAIVLANDSAIRLLNRDWRGKDAATNVLSFPARNPSGERPHIGDIVLAYETIAREARAQGKPFAHHVAHLTVHGFLHLNGYDHQRSKDADEMEQLERQILRRLAIPDPYRSLAKSVAKSPGKTMKRPRRLPLKTMRSR